MGKYLHPINEEIEIMVTVHCLMGFSGSILPHQFLAILYMLAALTYMSQASSSLEEPLRVNT